MATIPPERRVASTRAKAGRGDHVGERFGVRKLADRFDQIAIRGPVPGHDFAEGGNAGEGIGVVDPVEHRQVDVRKLEAKEAPTPLEHPKGLAERRLDSRHVSDAEGDRIGVEPSVGKRQRLRIGLDEGDAVSELTLARALCADAQHLGVDVGDGDTRLRPARPGDTEGDVARPSGDIEKGERARRWRMHFGGQDVLPHSVQSEGHQIVHQIVAVGDLMEDRVNQTLLFVHPNGALAEMRLFGRCRH